MYFRRERCNFAEKKRTWLEYRFKTVGELRTADLDEVSRQRQNFESQLHSQEDEVTVFSESLFFRFVVRSKADG